VRSQQPRDANAYVRRQVKQQQYVRRRRRLLSSSTDARARHSFVSFHAETRNQQVLISSFSLLVNLLQSKRLKTCLKKKLTIKGSE
jgi:hypothetical protein